MNRIIFVLLSLICSFNSFAIEVPPLTGRVNDYANLLSASTKEVLEQKSLQLEQKDSTQLVVLTIPSLNGDTIENFAVQVFNKWGIGQKKLDNGVLLAIALKERTIRIEVGRGLEGKLTDIMSSRIIRQEIVPYLAKRDFNTGVIKGVDAITAQIKGEYTKKQESTTQEISIPMMIFLVLFMTLWSFVIFRPLVPTTLPQETRKRILSGMVFIAAVLIYCAGQNFELYGVRLIALCVISLLLGFFFPKDATPKPRIIYASIATLAFIVISYLFIAQSLFILLQIAASSFIITYVTSYSRHIKLERVRQGSSGGSSSGRGGFSGGGGSSGGGGASGRF